MLSIPKRFTVTLDEADYARLRALAYDAGVAPAAKARDLIIVQLPVKDDGDG